MTNLVSYELTDGVARITMDDGRVNALSPQMFADLNAAFDRAQADGAIAILRGREGIFSAGFDLKVLTAGGPEGRSLVRNGFELAARIVDFDTPVVAVSTGHTIAMGAFLVMAADYRLGTAGPFRITCNEVKIGITMPRAALELTRPRLTPAHFYRAMILSEVFTPEDAVTAGFLDRVVDPEGLETASDEVAGALKDLDMQAYRATKQRVRGATSAAVRDAIEKDDSALVPAETSAPN
jgi:enoyl-CoA hydratase